MVRQQSQSRLGIFSLEVVETYRANRKPDCASERSICFFPSLDFVYPVSSDRLVLNNDGDFHSGVPPFLKRARITVYYMSFSDFAPTKSDLAVCQQSVLRP
jgi:hypothetical protein